MKVAPGEAERFLAAPPERVVAVLLHGADAGLVHERVDRLLAAVLGSERDPFRFAELSEAELRSDPARLADEFAAMALLGGRRAVRLRDVGESAKGIFERFLGEVAAGTLKGDALVVVEAGELARTSALRAAFEDAPHAAALACAPDGPAEIAALVADWAAREGLAVAAEAGPLLAEALEGDRARARGELEKLALYVGRGGTVDEAALAAVLVDMPQAGLFGVIDAAASGNANRVADELPLIVEEMGAVAPVRLLLEEMKRLHAVAGSVAEGVSAQDAVRRLRPPVFGVRASALAAKARAWTRERAARAVARLLADERAVKLTPGADAAIAERAFLEVARLASAKR